MKGETIAEAKQEIRLLERKTENLMERIVEADSASLITAYENQIRKLERKKICLSEKLAKYGQPAEGLKETYRTAMEFIANPLKLWASERLGDRRLLLRLAFGGRLPYLRNGGYRTAETTLPFKALAAISPGNSGMVGPEGFEPPT